MVCQLNEQNDIQLVEPFEYQYNGKIVYLANRPMTNASHLHLIIFKFVSPYNHKLHHI